MLRWCIPLALLLCLCQSLVVPKSNDGRLRNIRVNAKRFLPKKAQKLIYHHDPLDYTLLSTTVYAGVPYQFYGMMIDTTIADMWVHLCPTANPSQNDQPCYNHFQSESFIPTTNNITAADTFQGDNIDDHKMINLTFVLEKEKMSGRLGFAWPAIQEYPGNTYFPYEYFHQKPCARKFKMTIAKDGCVGGIGWGEVCDDWKFKTDLIPVTSRKYWTFGLYGFTLGNLTVPLQENAVIASNRAYIGMPKKYLDMITKQLNITWDNEFGGYTAWCYGNLPDFELKLDNVVLKLKPEQYLYTWQPLYNGKCILNFEDSQANGFGPEWYFGLPLFTSYCIGFDYDFGQIAFMYNDWYEGDTSCHQ